MKSTWEADISMFSEVKKGVKIILPHVWSRTDKGQTTPQDISLVVEHDMPIGQAVEMLEVKALEYVKSRGADDIRHYYIEDLSIQNNTITLVTGT
jgi:hypothetical protein